MPCRSSAICNFSSSIMKTFSQHTHIPRKSCTQTSVQRSERERRRQLWHERPWRRPSLCQANHRTCAEVRYIAAGLRVWHAMPVRTNPTRLNPFIERRSLPPYGFRRMDHMRAETLLTNVAKPIRKGASMYMRQILSSRHITHLVLCRTAKAVTLSVRERGHIRPNLTAPQAAATSGVRGRSDDRQTARQVRRCFKCESNSRI
jgi:hypothetical protein